MLAAWDGVFVDALALRDAAAPSPPCSPLLLLVFFFRGLSWVGYWEGGQGGRGSRGIALEPCVSRGLSVECARGGAVGPPGLARLSCPAAESPRVRVLVSRVSVSAVPRTCDVRVRL